jgi:SAM-dependent methyltransferase
MVDDTTRVCDHYLDEFRSLEERFGRAGREGSTAASHLAQQLVDLSDKQARHLFALASTTNGREVAAVLHAHPLHQEVILRSSIVKHALDKPRGYAGDMDLMLKICRQPPQPAGGFGEHLDAFYGNLPASQAVRDRVCMLGRLIDDLPPGRRVLNLACGPALEVQDHFRRRPDSTLNVDLVDHDPATLDYLRGRVPSGRVSLLQGNALRLMAGDLRLRRATSDNCEPDDQGACDEQLEPIYDLIYSAGLYDYLPDGQNGRGGVTALTAKMFSLLKPGGRLLVGNYLRPSPTSRHQPHHRAVMELYSKWHLRYRDMEEIRAFASGIDRPHTLELLDETGRRFRSADGSVIGFAAIAAS